MVWELTHVLLCYAALLAVCWLVGRAMDRFELVNSLDKTFASRASPMETNERLDSLDEPGASWSRERI